MSFCFLHFNFTLVYIQSSYLYDQDALQVDPTVCHGSRICTGCYINCESYPWLCYIEAVEKVFTDILLISMQDKGMLEPNKNVIGLTCALSR